MVPILPICGSAPAVRFLAQPVATDLQFVPKGSICAGLNYSYNAWSKYWEGETLRENGNVGTVSRQQITAGVMVGVLDRFNVIVMLPYASTKASQGTLNGQAGLQDISLNLKGKYLERKAGPRETPRGRLARIFHAGE